MSENENKAVENSSEKFIPIYFSDVVKGAFKFWWLCIILAGIIGGGMFFTSYRKYVPMYSCSETFTVETENARVSKGGISVYTYYYDATTATHLAETFPYILSSNLLSEAICEALDVNSFNCTLSATSVSNSNMFTITVKGPDPQECYDVLQAAIDRYPTIARYIVGNIKFTMITEPQVPENPYNKSSYVGDGIKGAVFGFAVGILLILVYALLRNTIRTKDDIKKELNCELLGSLPMVTFKKHRAEIDRSILPTNERVNSSFFESVRLIRNKVINNLDENEKLIMVTSTAPGEGKSTVAANLAISLANLDKKVLIIDCDMRNPSIKPLFGITDDNEELYEEFEYYRIVYLERFNVSVLTFAEDNEKYWKLMKVGFLKKYFNELKEKYDYIVIDTPPSGLVSDALSVAQSVDAVAYVILQDTIMVPRIRSSLDSILSTDTKLLGCIINGAASGHVSYGHNYGYGYGYGYGYRYGRYGYGYGRYGYGYGKYGYGESNEKKRSKKRRRKKEEASNLTSEAVSEASEDGEANVEE